MDILRESYKRMCCSVNGGWAAMAAALGLTKNALENRVYERTGQSVDVDLAMNMQATSGTTLFAEAVARESGGVFVSLPPVEVVDNEEIQLLYMQAVEEIGNLAHCWRKVTADNVVTPAERREMEDIQRRLVQKTQQMNTLTFRLFCEEAR
ncbi:YmfL family putative regulatory protein [Laribacter hongkongensis]|uniref:YmfL family putative regulatory protein n=1 Tax=Laribacter hongkongensis TaxID=168471 RepID=UPI001EFD53C8|nr:YmfL family putative regulatory protein [Laribacter hongkongensis]MCG8998417.1 hypothetical protein [Laribacter hongkongensis]MCG9013586.1 hypothetical protein [Laribacter hongkongensis]